MLHLSKKGFVLINTIIITSLIMTLSCVMFSLMKNNRDISDMYYVDNDIFSVSNDEEEIIYDFMNKLNAKTEKVQEDITSDANVKYENSDKEDIYDINMVFQKDFEEKINQNILVYNKKKDNLIIKIPGEYDSVRIRELKYIIKENKIMLIPTSYYFDTNIDEIGSNV